MSTNGGVSWTLLKQAISPINPIYGRAVSRIIVDPNNPFLIYVADSDQVVNARPGTPGIAAVGVWRFSQTFNANTNTFSNQDLVTT